MLPAELEAEGWNRRVERVIWGTISHSIVREQDIRDYKEQDRLVAPVVQPSDPASIAAFRFSRSVLCDMDG